MATGQPGEQGEVTIWAPDGRRSFLQPLYWAGLVVCLFTELARFACGPISVVEYAILIPALFGSPGWFLRSLATLFRKQYLTTDTAGLTVATRKGTVTVQWEDVLAMGRGGPHFGLSTFPGERHESISLDLSA